jgi:hypothetical protein
LIFAIEVARFYVDAICDIGSTLWQSFKDDWIFSLGIFALGLFCAVVFPIGRMFGYVTRNRSNKILQKEPNIGKIYENLNFYDYFLFKMHIEN